jgi:hypothetical protein
MKAGLFIPPRTHAQLDCMPPADHDRALSALEAIRASHARTTTDPALSEDRRIRKLASIERLFIAELEAIDRACDLMDSFDHTFSSAA